MKKVFEKGQPVVRGRSAIVHWDLYISFLCKEQLAKFIKLMLKEEIDYKISVGIERGDSVTPDIWTLTIHDMSWANNLTRIGTLLEKVDYHA